MWCKVRGRVGFSQDIWYGFDDDMLILGSTLRWTSNSSCLCRSYQQAGFTDNFQSVLCSIPNRLMDLKKTIAQPLKDKKYFRGVTWKYLLLLLLLIIINIIILFLVIFYFIYFLNHSKPGVQAASMLRRSLWGGGTIAAGDFGRDSRVHLRLWTDRPAGWLPVGPMFTSVETAKIHPSLQASDYHQPTSKTGHNTKTYKHPFPTSLWPPQPNSLKQICQSKTPTSFQ